MIYSFKCGCGSHQEVSCSIQDGPPSAVECSSCGDPMQRDWQADEPMIDTSNCRDHNFIPREKRVYRPGTKGQADKLEGKMAKHINERRSQLRDSGNKGLFKHKMSIPADLYHGKIRETGDKQYWNDPKNVAKHNDFKVG